MLGTLPKSKGQRTYVIVVIDVLSKFIKVKTLATTIDF